MTAAKFQSMYEKAEAASNEIPDYYDITVAEIQELMRLAHSQDAEHVFKAITTAFNYGFFKGNQATINRKLKKL